MSEWQTHILEEVVERFIDYRGKTPTKTDSGVPLITAKIVKNGKISEPNEFISEEEYSVRMTRGYPKKNDVVLTTEAPLGEVALIKDERVSPAQRIITIQTDEKKLHSPFLKYFLQSEIGQHELYSRASGTTVVGIKSALLKKVPVAAPPINEQRAIAEILLSLDDKIDLLHRQNQTLEQISETLFRQWFVEQADEDWENGLLEDLIDVKYGKDHKKLLDGNVPVYGSGGLIRHVQTPLFEGESVLIPRKGTLNNVMYVDESFWTVDTMFYTVMKKKNLSKFVYQFIKQKDLASMNVGSAVPSMTTAVLNNMPIQIPPDDLLERFDNIVSEFYSKIKSNQTQISTLSALRDTLLPKLMSGKVKITEN